MNKIGSIGSVFLIPNLDEPATLGMNAFMLRVSQVVAINKYIFYYLKSNFGKKQIIDKQLGVNAKTITKDAVKSIKIPLPPLDIQKQIVAKLDKEMEVLQSVQELKNQAEDRINKILKEAWGE